MEIPSSIQIIVFVVLSLIAVGGALGMTTTMSMFRSGIFLMASFFGVAGLFILLLADLLGLLQVMMYIGGMLVMILFMVLFSQDPGGRMMTGMMELPLLERFFSLGLAHKDTKRTQKGTDHKARDHQAEHQHEPTENHLDGHANQNQEQKPDGGEAKGETADGMDMQMDMAEMSMSTPIKKPAAIISTAIGTLLLATIFLRPVWSNSSAIPAADSPKQIGSLLMGKYMMGFEGAGLMILLGIFSAVYLSRSDKHSDPIERADLRAAVTGAPSRVAADSISSASSLDDQDGGRL